MTETVLVIAAHPDDEVLGCGATMARHAHQGDDVHVLFVADGVTSRVGTNDTDRREPARRAASILGCREPVFFDLPDQKLDARPFLEIAQAIEPTIEQIKPTIIYTHHNGDLNLDHRLVHQAVLTALRPLPSSTFKSIFAFEVASSTEWGEGFRPDKFINISDFIDRKMEALHAYDHEMRAFPHARSYEALRALATLRGVSVGLPAAEAFMTLRTIER